ncbi:uncharacterized protein At2g27730, mitochondrial-like [Cynara cardunculus var. scolymus]|uniref:uncharacterized protein At2g27730, mitochondrial-like n=1 Tax=Cynara cardunculus var. scolymus TaxID=59895 RepID=UPI000D627A97|nr:uncharacterized protein At2g27730, mitochondrial-like [Cynara cardunculus var. scolymus]
MATRQVFRYVSRRFSTGGKVLGEEEKAAENVYIKKTEREKLEKLAQKGPKPEETPAANAGGSGTGAEAKASESTSAKTGVSTDDHRNYAVVAGVVTGLSALGWYLLSKDKKTEELHD